MQLIDKYSNKQILKKLPPALASADLVKHLINYLQPYVRKFFADVTSMFSLVSFIQESSTKCRS